MSKIEKLLEGVEVGWKPLARNENAVAELCRGRVMSKSFLEENIGVYPVYSSQTANNGEIGSINTFDFDGEAVTWTTDGANAGTVFHRTGKFSITNVCGLIKILETSKLNYRFLFYWLSIEAKKYVYSGMGNPKLMSHQMEKIMIPIPCPENPKKSLEIQKEIVRILDTFTERTETLINELTTELEARKKQYSYYREELLSFNCLNQDLQDSQNFQDKVEWKTLGEVATIGTGSRNTNESIVEGKYPFFVRSQEPRAINEYEFDETAIITAGDGVGVGKVFHYVIGKYALHQRAYRIVANDNSINLKYLFHYMKNNFAKYLEMTSVHASVTSLRKPMFEKYPVPIPSPKEQERIVAILDKLDSLTTSISEALPKEIALRKKQYEYYRDRLLTFK